MEDTHFALTFPHGADLLRENPFEGFAVCGDKNAKMLTTLPEATTCPACRATATGREARTLPLLAGGAR